MKHVWVVWASHNGSKACPMAFVSGETLEEASADAIRVVDVNYGTEKGNGEEGYWTAAEVGVEIVGLKRGLPCYPTKREPE